MPQDPLQALAPCNNSLLKLAITNLDDSMLREIAAADYGMDQDNHYEALTNISRGTLSDPNNWHPKEVLELTRWSEPDQPRQKGINAGTRGHWMRLFACTVLMRHSCLPDGCDLSHDSTIIQLSESAAALGPRVITKALSFLSWYLQEDEEELCHFSAIAILLLAAPSQSLDPVTSAWLASVIRGEFEQANEWDQWSLDPKDVFSGSMLKQKWRRLTQEILLAPDQQNLTLHQIAEELLG